MPFVVLQHFKTLSLKAEYVRFCKHCSDCSIHDNIFVCIYKNSGLFQVGSSNAEDNG